MDEQVEKVIAEESGYQPRPRWQVWGARIGLILFLILIFLYYRSIAGGGI